MACDSMALSANRRGLFGFQFGKRAPVLEPSGFLTGKSLPTPDRHVDIERVDLATVGDSGRGLRGNDRRTAAHERVVNRLARVGVIDDRAAHEFDWFLATMIRNEILAGISFDHFSFDHGRFVSVAVLIGRFAFLDRVATGFMLIAVVTSRKRGMFLNPNQSSAYLIT